MRIFSVAIESEETIAIAAIDLIPVPHTVGLVLKQFGAVGAPDLALIIDHGNLD